MLYVVRKWIQFLWWCSSVVVGTFNIIASMRNSIRGAIKKRTSPVYYHPPASVAAASNPFVFGSMNQQENSPPVESRDRVDPITKGTVFSSWDEVYKAVDEHNQKLRFSFVLRQEFMEQSEGVDKAMGGGHPRIRKTFVCSDHDSDTSRESIIASMRNSIRGAIKKRTSPVYYHPPASVAAASNPFVFGSMNQQENSPPVESRDRVDPITKGTVFSSWDEVYKAVDEHNQKLRFSFVLRQEFMEQSEGVDKAMGGGHPRIRKTFVCSDHDSDTSRERIACPATIQFDCIEEARICLTSLDLHHTHPQSKMQENKNQTNQTADQMFSMPVDSTSEPVTSSPDIDGPTTVDEVVMASGSESKQEDTTASEVRNQGHNSSGEREVRDTTPTEGGITPANKSGPNFTMDVTNSPDEGYNTQSCSFDKSTFMTSTPNPKSGINQAVGAQNLDVEICRDNILVIINEMASDLKTVGHDQTCLRRITESVDLKVSKMAESMRAFRKIVADNMESKCPNIDPLSTPDKRQPPSNQQKSCPGSNLPSPNRIISEEIQNMHAVTFTQDSDDKNMFYIMRGSGEALSFPCQALLWTAQKSTTVLSPAQTMAPLTVNTSQTQTSKAESTMTTQSPAPSVEKQTLPSQSLPPTQTTEITPAPPILKPARLPSPQPAPPPMVQTPATQPAPPPMVQTTPTQPSPPSMVQTPRTQTALPPMVQTPPTQQAPPTPTKIQQPSTQATSAAEQPNTSSPNKLPPSPSTSPLASPEDDDDTSSSLASSEDDNDKSSVDAATYLKSIDLGLKFVAQQNLEKRLNGKFRGSKFEVLGINKAVTKGYASRMENYDLLFNFSDFMDPDAGIFTIPASGRYRFDVTYKQLRHGKGRVYLTRDDGERLMIGKFSEDGDGDSTAVEWDCDKGSCVWVEAVRVAGGGVKLKWLRFRGEYLE